MTALNYTTGNPNNLVGGGNASMNDIQGPFVDLRTYLNGGNLDETNVPNLAAAFTTYRDIQRAAGVITAAAGAGTYSLTLTGAASNSALIGANFHDTVIWLDPTDYNANARTTKLRIRLSGASNSVGSAVTYTAGLYLITGLSGTGPANPVVASVGAAISGSTAAIVNPSPLTPTTQVSTDFNCPAAGAYVIGLVTSGAQITNGVTQFVAKLQMRQV